MKLRSTIFPLMLAGATIAVLALMNQTQKPAASAVGNTEEVEEEHEQALIQAYYDYMFELQKNPFTGELTFADVYAGRMEVLEKQAASTRGGLLEWEFMGPNNVGGRTRSILIDPTNPSRMYAGSVSGGVFITDNGGLSWYPSPGTETMENINISSMARTANGDIYIGTGEDFLVGIPPFEGTSSETHRFTGNGMYKSTDGCQTFTQLSATEPTPGVLGTSSGVDWAYVYRIATNSSDANLVVAGHNGGLQYSTDGGASWTFCTNTTSGEMDLSPAIEVVFDAEGRLHAIYGNRYYRSVSAADPFTLELTGEGLPTSSIGRVVLAVAPSNSNYVYAYVANSARQMQGIYRSTDGGATFGVISPEASDLFNPPGDQGNYNLCIAVNPADENRVYVGGQIDSWTWKSSTGAWTPMSNSGYPEYFAKYIHADHHTIVFHPTNPDIMYFGTDGGISRTTNARADYPDFGTLNKGYSTYQAHGVSIGFNGEAMAGSQDNGTQYVNFLGNSDLEALKVLGGDGGRGEISKIRPEYLIASYADFSGGSSNGGALRRSVNGGSTMGSFFDPNIDGGTDPDGLPDGGGEFVAAYTMWENWDLYETFSALLTDDSVEYPAGSGIYYFTGDVVNYEGRDIEMTRSGINESRFVLSSGANVWLTNGVLFNSTENPTWFDITTGSTIGIPTAFSFTNDGDVLFVGTSSGRLYRYSGLLEADWEYVDLDLDGEADDFDPAIAGITQYLYPELFGARITDVSCNGDDPDQVVLSLGGYGVDDNVYYSDDAMSDDAATFVSIADDLPNVPVYSILISRSNPDIVLAGTEFGVWSYSLSTGGVWNSENAVVGNVPVFDIKEDWIRTPGCNAIYIGTHGRGYWRSVSLNTGTGCDFSLGAPDDAGPIQEEIIAGIVISPNPTDEYAEATMTLTEAANVNIGVLNMSGIRVMDLGTVYYAAGVTRIPLNVKTLSAGTYLVVFTVDGVITSRKITVY